MKDIKAVVTANNIVFEEAAEYFGHKIPVTSSEFYALAEEYKALVFTVSGYTKMQVLKQFHETLLEAIEHGTTMEVFRQGMNEFLENNGYEGLTRFQADNIFRTNIQTAYQVGHHENLTNPAVKKARPYWQYVSVEDSRTRPSHRAMDGRVFKADNPIWDTWYPPNGFRCRCTVTSLSEKQVKDRGLTVEQQAPTAVEVDGQLINITPDENFATNPAKQPFKPDLKNVPKPLKRAYERLMESEK